ncbi:capsule assembly Wzi family protein [Parapedobacter koreensis]|uniref:capsule assembly Wzi family protein n=1 Tax=Parapedobacter koreensis TaxID=332977 RepID=UPI0015A5F116|nr:capsule assembly Wzi family protein [Parapedobacter koreensis]
MTKITYHRRYCVNYVLSAIMLSVFYGTGWAQSLPVGTPLLEDFYRREQLLGRLDSTVSFSIRPLTNAVIQRLNIYKPNGVVAVRDKSIYNFTTGDTLKVHILPVQWRHQINTTIPYGWNDGAMIPSAGYQTMAAAGIYMQYKFLSIQLRPEYVLAQNKAYQGYNGKSAREWSQWYVAIGNSMDKPERFGEGWYSKFLPGQSSIRLNFDPVSIGLSSENLWWGPSLYNSLMMSNTAPGFAHLTLNTTRPVKTPIGAFEGQLIAGRLEESGYLPTPSGNPDHFDNYYRPKSDDWRYLSGLVLTYQPKWLPGLSIGFSRAFMMYSESLEGKIANYLPFFAPTSKSSYSEEQDSALNEGEGIARDELLNMFVRWVIPAANAEAYFEYGRNDHPWDSRDLVVQLEHSRSYIFGFRKLTPLNWLGTDYLNVNLEVAQTEGSKTEDIRRGGPWYRHGGVRHGYTHLGQLIGAGIDPGSNLQTLNFSWIREMKQLGVQFQRYVHNNDFFYRISDDMRRNWVDISMALYGEWDYKNLLISSQLHFIKAMNYQYELEEKPEIRNYWSFDEQDKFNLQFQVGLFYQF